MLKSGMIEKKTGYNKYKTIVMSLYNSYNNYSSMI